MVQLKPQYKQHVVQLIHERIGQIFQEIASQITTIKLAQTDECVYENVDDSFNLDLIASILDSSTTASDIFDTYH